MWFWLNPTLLCVLFGLLGTIPLAFLTPPFQVPDEGQHFARAYQISEGQLAGIVQNSEAGAILPSAIPELVERFLGTRAIHADRPLRNLPWAATSQARAIPLDPARREFVGFSGAVLYFPLPYLPQAAAIWAGRSAGLGVLDLLYAARLANALVAVLVLAWAVRLLPVGRWASLLIALFPMALFEYASASPDALMIAAAFLFTALALRARARDWTAGSAAVALACALIFCPLKVVYAPLLLLSLPASLLPRVRWGALIGHLVLVGLVVGVTVFWLRFSALAVVTTRAGTDMAAQLAAMRIAPFRFLAVLLDSFRENGAFVYRSLYGVLGWLKIPFPPPIYWLPAIGLLGCAIAEVPRPRLSRWWSLWDFGLVLASVVLIETALYIYWTPVGNSQVDGVQGRYFFPVLPALAASVFALIQGNASARVRLLGRISVAGVLFGGVLLTYAAVVRAYAVF